jgi:hemoglobin
MPRIFRHSLLVALMLGFLPASVLNTLAAPLPTPAAPQAAAAQDSLYKRLGGYDALAAVTDDFLGRPATDPKEGRFFVGLSNDSKTRVRQHVVDFLCVATGPLQVHRTRYGDRTHRLEHHRRELDHRG